MNESPAAASICSAPSCQECVIRLAAAAHHARCTVAHLHQLNELTRSISDSVASTAAAVAASAVTTASPSPSLPPPEAGPEQGKEELITGSAAGVPILTSCTTSAPTDEFWRVWRTTSEADALFHRSGMSTAFCSLERSVCETASCFLHPRLLLLQEKVRRLSDKLECDARRVVMEAERRSRQAAWTVDAVSVLAPIISTSPSAAEASEADLEENAAASASSPQTTAPKAAHTLLSVNSTLWSDLEADLDTVLTSAAHLNKSSSAMDSTLVNHGRLHQQHQRISQLLHEVITTVALQNRSANI